MPATKTKRAAVIDVWDRGQVPAGLSLLYAGDTYQTRRVMAMCAEAGQTVYRERWMDGDYSRVRGYHVPAEMIERARADDEATEEKRRATRQKRYASDVERFTARIRTQFPSCPEAAEIAAHACRVGSGRVGRSTTVDTDAAVRLAVIAHIRHVHTAYDAILSSMSDSDFFEYEDEIICAMKDGEDFFLPTRRERARDAVREDIDEILEDWSMPYFPPLNLKPKYGPCTTRRTP